MIICVDFDGTMVNHTYPDTGEAVPGAVEWCKKLVKEGCHLILWTMRSGKTLQDAVDFFVNNDIDLLSVGINPMQHRWTTSRKCYANLYIDDAALGCPLIQVEGWDRPCVDWETVGPMVMQIIEDTEIREAKEREDILRSLLESHNK